MSITASARGFGALGSLERHEDVASLEHLFADALRSFKPGEPLAGFQQLTMPELQLAFDNRLRLDPAIQMSAEDARVAMQGLQWQPSTVIDDALGDLSKSYVEAAGRFGLQSGLIGLLEQWVSATVNARMLQQQVELRRVLDTVQALQSADAVLEHRNPTEPLSAAELGQRLGNLGDEAVRVRERNGKLFSILRPGRQRGREYPAFQAWPEIAGQPLEQVMTALGQINGADAYGFFNSKNDLLGGLTPVEVMRGALLTSRNIEPEALELLRAPAQERQEKVKEAATAYVAVLLA